MHEYSLTCSIIQILEKIIKENNVKKVESINFDLSPFASIEPESIKFYFNFLTEKNEKLRDARLKFYSAKINLKCKRCSQRFSSRIFPLSCPKCNSMDICILNKDLDDIRIKSISTSE